MSLKTWRNGEKASIVKKIIEDNFKISTKYLNRNMLSLSTEERLLLSSDYLSDGLVVYDTTEDAYFKYNSQKASWEPKPTESDSQATSKTFCYEFEASQWSNNIISLPYELHKIENPMVFMFMLRDNSYKVVLCDVEIDTQFNIILSTDLPFAGKVVVK